MKKERENKMINLLKVNYYNGCFIYLYTNGKRYFKILVDKEYVKKGNVQLYKQDKRGKLISSYKLIGDFLNFKLAKKHLYEQKIN
jgi:hypothetical protein